MGDHCMLMANRHYGRRFLLATRCPVGTQTTLKGESVRYTIVRRQDVRPGK